MVDKPQDFVHLTNLMHCVYLFLIEMFFYSVNISRMTSCPVMHILLHIISQRTITIPQAAVRKGKTLIQ